MMTRAGWKVAVGMVLLPRDGRRVAAALVVQLPATEHGEVVLSNMARHGMRSVAFRYISDRYSPAARKG